jgi:hypothetical protein
MILSQVLTIFENNRRKGQENPCGCWFVRTLCYVSSMAPTGHIRYFFPYFCAEKNTVMEELKRVKLFAGCSDESLERLLENPCRRQDYPAGRRMLNPGDPCRALMVLV